MKKPLFFCPVLLLIIVAVLAFVGGMKASFPPQPVYHLTTGDNTVLFTFNILWEGEGENDENGAEELNEVLVFLKSQDIEAVFFVTGEWINKFPVSANKILQHGHYLGNRSLSHRRFTLLTDEEARAEIEGFNHICAEKLDYTPSFFRPPYGEYNSRIVRLAEEAGCLTLLWTINARTMSINDLGLAMERFEERLYPGSIILFHLYPGVASLLPSVVDFLDWKGYNIASPEILLR